jgi:hypothetical protein
MSTTGGSIVVTEAVRTTEGSEEPAVRLGLARLAVRIPVQADELGGQIKRWAGGGVGYRSGQNTQLRVRVPKTGTLLAHPRAAIHILLAQVCSLDQLLLAVDPGQEFGHRDRPRLRVSDDRISEQFFEQGFSRVQDRAIGTGAMACVAHLEDEVAEGPGAPPLERPMALARKLRGEDRTVPSEAANRLFRGTETSRRIVHGSRRGMKQDDVCI